jgi:hypothetical protein
MAGPVLAVGGDGPVPGLLGGPLPLGAGFHRVGELRLVPAIGGLPGMSRPGDRVLAGGPLLVAAGAGGQRFGGRAD